MKAKKQPRLILDDSSLEEEFFEDITLMGIVSARKPHQLAWYIREYTGYLFHRNHDFQNVKAEFIFPVFYLEEKLQCTEHFLFTNRIQKEFLIPEAKNIDFIWMIKSNMQRIELRDKILPKLSGIPSIDFAFDINPANLKSRQVLVV